jgi:hypothetical protein
MGDEAVRASHAALNGLILPANDPFWQDHYPPWDYGCRCQIIPVDEDDYQAALDEGRVAGKQGAMSEEGRANGWVLGEKAYQRLVDTGDLDWGAGQPVNVLSPYKRAKDEKERQAAYRWNPADISISLDTLKTRYDKETFDHFERQAKATEIDGGITLWDRLSGKKPKAKKTKTKEVGRAITPKQMTARVVKAVKEITPSEMEIFVVMSKDGKEIFPRHTSGPRGGNLPSRWVDNLKDATLVHNHPSGLRNKGYGSSFSLADIQTSSDQKLARIVAGSGRRTYIMEPGPDGWPAQREIFSAFKSSSDEVASIVEARISRGSRKIWRYNQIHNHLVWRKVAKTLGMKYQIIRNK